MLQARPSPCVGYVVSPLDDGALAIRHEALEARVPGAAEPGTVPEGQEDEEPSLTRSTSDPSPKQKGHPVRGGLFTSSGAGERSRTPDLRITNALLYQLSYAG